MSWLGPLTSWYGVAWELLPRGRVRLVREYGGKDMAPRLAHPKTLREAVALMLPSAHTATRRHDPAITGTCPPSPAAVAASPVPGEEPAESPAMTPTWLLALGAGGRLAAGSPCAFDTLVAWPGGYLASSHAGTGARRRLVADWVSPDAVTWTRHDPAGDSAARALAGPAVASGDGLLRFGSDGGDLAIWSSTDGAAWSRLPDDPALRTGASWLDLQAAVSGERVLVTGTGRDRCTVLGCRERTWTWTSDDGAAWTRTDPDGRLLPRPAVPLAGWDGGFVALGDHRAVLTSADGVTWQATGRLPDDLVLTGSFAAIPGDTTVTWFTLRPLGDALGTQVVSVQRSTDLRAWTEVAVSDGLGTWPPAIGAGPTGLTLAGADRERRPWAMTSADGSAWTPPTSSPDLSFGVPVAAAGGPAGPVLVSAGDNADGALAWRFGPP